MKQYQRIGCATIIVNVILLTGTAASASAQTASPCLTLWGGFNQAYPDADIAVGRNQVLIADHDFFKLFNRCGNQQAFTLPAAPVCLVNGLHHTGVEGTSACGPIDGFFYSLVPLGQLQNPTNFFGDERLIYDRTTQRYFVMAAGDSLYGVHLGVSAVQDADTWDQIEAFPMEVPCGSTVGGALHRGSISTWHGLGVPSDGLLWFMGETQESDCTNVGQWSVAKISVNGLLTNDPDPDAWWQDPSAEYWYFVPTLARRITQDATPQYGIGVNTSDNKLELVALRQEETPTGELLAPYRHTIQLGAGTPHPAFQALPDPLHATGDPIRTKPMTAIWKAIYVDGAIWAVHCDGYDGRSLVRWCRIEMNNWMAPGSTGTPEIDQSGFLDPGNGLDCYVPSVAAHPNFGPVAITYNATSEEQNISIYSNIRCNDQVGFESAQLLYTHSVAIVTGTFPPPELHNTDYSGTVEDPFIPGRFWTHHALAGGGLVNSIVARFEGCGADYTGDGLANGNDAAVFGSLFQAASPEADFKPDDIIDTEDFIEYLSVGLP